MSVDSKGHGGHSSGVFAILMYHRIAPCRHPLTLRGHRDANIVISPETFARHLSVLKDKANVIPLNLALQLSKQYRLPTKAVVLTFDDGFREHFEEVVTRLTLLQMEATFFVTGYGIFPEFGLRWLEWIDAANQMLPSAHPISVGEHEFFIGGHSDISPIKKSFRHLNSAKQQEAIKRITRDLGLLDEDFNLLRDQLFVSRNRLLQLKDVEYVTIGGHSLSHPLLSSLSNECKREEILGSLNMLKTLAQHPPHSFAYPFGGMESYDDECRLILGEVGFTCAVTSVPGLNSAHTPIFDLKRFDMNRTDVSEILELFP